MIEQLILNQLYTMPERLKKQVLDFVYELTPPSTPIQQEEKRYPVFGSAKGKYVLSADFDEPLEDFK